MKDLKTKVRNMNPHKGFRMLVLTAIIIFIVAGIGMGIKFGSRIPEIKQSMDAMEQAGETSDVQYSDERDGYEEYGKYEKFDNQEKYGRYEEYGKYENYGKYEKHGEYHEADWENVIPLSTSDYAFLGIAAAAFLILFGVYWLYTTAYVVSKSWEVGASAHLFGVLTLFTNLFGVAILWIYIRMQHMCPDCGRLQPRKANNCSYCGSAIFVKCPECGERISVKDQYCNGCGRKMDQKGKQE